jgi:hypothetical protein
LASRYVDPAKSLGNRAPDEPLFRPEPLEVIPGRSFSYEDELARIRQIWSHAAAGARASRPSAPFRTRSLRRGV